MRQRVSFNVGGRELEGTLHLPGRSALGGALVLHGYGGHPEQPHIVATAQALADAGIAALRFAYRDHEPPRMTLDTGLADAAAALGLLRAHRDVGPGVGIVGFSFGGAVAALLAGRERQIRFAVLAAAPAAFQHDSRPERAAARTKGRVLLLWGTRDTEVSLDHAERYADALAYARVPHRFEAIEDGDHDFAPGGPRSAMASTVAAFAKESVS
ncbi:MAG: hypothetical protein FJ034_08920 [Chloroflexi bacterium]|nr:hypothetical protein [Chloroflexota bacterium]